MSGEREAPGVENSAVKGIPNFWSTVLQNNEMLMESFGPRDLQVLEYLEDIQEEVFFDECMSWGWGLSRCIKGLQG